MLKIRPRLKSLRSQRGIRSVRMIADATGISPTTLYNFENCRTRSIEYSVLERLCQFLEVQPAELFEVVQDDDTEAFLSKCGGWEDDREATAIATDIRKQRRSIGDETIHLFDSD